MLIFEPGKLRKLFGSDYNQISVIPIDVTQVETHTFNHTITRKPVQDGATISDNILIEPDSVTIQGIFTDRSAFSAITQIAESFIDGVDRRTDMPTWEDKLAKLHEIRKMREPFTLVTSLGTYKNMFFDGAITVNRDLTTSDALFFTATLTGINIISARTTQVPASAMTDEKNGGSKKMAPKKDVGKKSNTAGQINAAGKKVSTATQERSKSWMLYLGQKGANVINGWLN